MGFLSYGYKAIKSVRPKTKVSDATKKFKLKIEQTKKAIKKGTDDFKKENPNRSVTDKQIKTIQRQQTEKSNKKTRKEFLRERKAVGGTAGLGKRMGREDRKIAGPKNTPQQQRRGEGKKRKPSKLLIVIDDGKLETRERKMGGGMMGRPMYKKGSKKAVGKKSDFGMLSVKAGIDNNPKPTQADRIAGAKMKKKS
jgi:hypothetical protein